YPHPASSAVSAAMRGNVRRDTRPECTIRSLLHHSGLRFRKDFRIQVGSHSCRPDIVFTRFRLAVFVDGCFWHACPLHWHMPSRNVEYWSAKFARNRERDIRNNEVLRRAGWTVLRVWEHVPPAEAALKIRHCLDQLAAEVAV